MALDVRRPDGSLFGSLANSAFNRKWSAELACPKPGHKKMSNTDEKLNLILMRLDDFIYRMVALENDRRVVFHGDDDEPCPMCSG